VPAGTIITLLPFDRQGSDEPHFLQKAVAKYLVSLGRKLTTDDWPLSQLNCSGVTNRFEAWALPVTFRQREQWQY